MICESASMCDLRGNLDMRLCDLIGCLDMRFDGGILVCDFGAVRFGFTI